MNIALYLRMSTDKQENSIESQRKILCQFAAQRGLNHVKTYVDEGISGRRADKRPAFLRMVEESAAGEFQGVLVYDSSRFARNLEESLVYKSILARNGVCVISATEPAPEGDGALITDAMLGALNELYSRKLSTAVKRGMVHQAAQGKHQCAPPLGYRKVSGTLQIHSEEAAIIRQIFSLFLEEHLSCTQIALRFNEAGIPKRRSCTWYARDFSRILQNPTYAGYIRFDGQTYPGRHPALIDPPQWAAAQRRFRPAAPKAARAKARHWLSGILECAHCGGHMVFVTDTKGNSGFRCGNYGNGRCRHSNFVAAATAEAVVFSALNDHLDTALLARFFLPPDVRPTAAALAHPLLRQALAAQEQRLHRCREAYRAGIDTLAEYDQAKRSCREKIALLQQQMDANSAAHADLAPKDSIHFADGAALLHSPRIAAERKNTALRLIFPRIILNKSLNIFVVHYFKNTVE